MKYPRFSIKKSLIVKATSAEFSKDDFVEIECGYPVRGGLGLGIIAWQEPYTINGRIQEVTTEGLKIDTSKQYESNIQFINYENIKAIN